VVVLARRAVSSVIAEALLIIVGVSLAATLASVVLSRVSVLQSRLVSISADAVQALSERLTYVYALYDEPNERFIIYIKNVGRYPVYPIEEFTVFFGDTSHASYYVLSTNPSPKCGCWSYEEYGTSNGVIEPGELVAFYVYNASVVRAPYYFKLVTARGSSLEVTFAP